MFERHPQLVLALVVLVVVCALIVAALLVLGIWHRPQPEAYDSFAIEPVPPPPAEAYRQFDVGTSWRGDGDAYDFRVAAAHRAGT